MDWEKFADALINESAERLDQAYKAAVHDGMTSNANSRVTAGIVLASIAKAVRASINKTDEAA